MKKRILSLVLAFVMVFSLAVPTFAAGAKNIPIADQVKLLEGLELISGEGSGVTSSYLTKKMTRMQAACALLKMIGKYDEAKDFFPIENFPDARGSWTAGNNIMGYLKANPGYGFSGDAGRFNPTGSITQQELFKVVLTQLAFIQEIDYKWEGVTAFGIAKGLVSVDGVYNTQALVQNVYSALTIPNKITKVTLAEKLAVDPAKKALLVAAGLLATETTELSAVSAEFLNLRQIKVIFSKTLAGEDLDTAKEITNYTVNDTSLTENTATISTSGREVVITLQGSITVANGKVNNSVEFMDTKFDKLTSIDMDLPTIVGYKINGPREIELEFSEAVISTSTAFKLNNGKIAISVPTGKYSNSLIIKTYADLKDGEYTLTVRSEDNSKVVDGASYPVLPQDYTINVVRDVTAPTVEVTNVVVRDKTVEVDIKFDRHVKINNLKARLGHVQGLTGTIKNEENTIDASKEYTIKFDTSIAPGTQTIYFVNGTTKAKDTWGNVFEDQTLAFDVVLDTQAPTVRSIVAKDSTSLVVTFSEEVVTTVTGNGAPTKYNFVVKDAKNSTKAVSGVVTAKEKVTLTMAEPFTGGVYTVEVKNLQDRSIYKNKLVAVTMSVDTKDKVAPYVKTIAPAGDNKYTVVFSEAMDSAAADKSNWKVALKTPIGKDDTTKSIAINSITMASDNKSIVIDLKVKGDTVTKKVFTAGVDQFAASIDSLRDMAGNSLTGMEKNDIDIRVNSAVSGFTVTIDTLPIVPMVSASKIQLMDNKTIRITFKDSIMENIDPKTFVVNGQADVVSGLGMEVYDNSDTIITLSLKEDKKIGGTQASDLDSLTVKDSIAKDQYGYEIENTKDYLGAEGVIDKAPPTMESASIGVLNDTDKDNQKQSIEVKFSESLYTASVQDADFVVDGQTIQYISVKDNMVTIHLKNVEYDLLETEVLVTLVGSVQDEFKNETTENTELNAKGPTDLAKAQKTASTTIATAQTACTAGKDIAAKATYQIAITAATKAVKAATTVAGVNTAMTTLAAAGEVFARAEDAVMAKALADAKAAVVAPAGAIGVAEELAKSPASEEAKIVYKFIIEEAKTNVGTATTVAGVTAAVAPILPDAEATMAFKAAVTDALVAAKAAVVAEDGAIGVAEALAKSPAPAEAKTAYNTVIQKARLNVEKAKAIAEVTVAVEPILPEAEATIDFKVAVALEDAKTALLAPTGTIGLAEIAHKAQSGDVNIATHPKTIYGKAIEVAKKAVLDAKTVEEVKAVTAVGSTFAKAKTEFEKAIAVVTAIVKGIPEDITAQVKQIGEVIVPPTAIGCTFVIKTNDGIISVAAASKNQVIKHGTVVYTMTHTASGLTTEVSVIVSAVAIPKVPVLKLPKL